MPGSTGYVRARRAGNTPTSSGQLTIPASIFRALPEGAVFSVEVAPEGLLYRYVGLHPPVSTKGTADLPFVEKGE